MAAPGLARSLALQLHSSHTRLPLKPEDGLLPIDRTYSDTTNVHCDCTCLSVRPAIGSSAVINLPNSNFIVRPPARDFPCPSCQNQAIWRNPTSGLNEASLCLETENRPLVHTVHILEPMSVPDYCPYPDGELHPLVFPASKTFNAAVVRCRRKSCSPPASLAATGLSPTALPATNASVQPNTPTSTRPRTTHTPSTTSA